MVKVYLIMMVLLSVVTMWFSFYGTLLAEPAREKASVRHGSTGHRRSHVFMHGK